MASIGLRCLPASAIPHRVKLTVHSGGTADLSVEHLQTFIARVEAGQTQIHNNRVFRLEEIVEAHHYMESNQATGKLVVLVNEP